MHIFYFIFAPSEHFCLACNAIGWSFYSHRVHSISFVMLARELNWLNWKEAIWLRFVRPWLPCRLNCTSIQAHAHDSGVKTRKAVDWYEPFHIATQRGKKKSIFWLHKNVSSKWRFEWRVLFSCATILCIHNARTYRFTSSKRRGGWKYCIKWINHFRSASFMRRFYSLFASFALNIKYAIIKQQNNVNEFGKRLL